MNHDAQEAALGLLGLSPSSSIPSPSTIPLKRKQGIVILNDVEEDTSTDSIQCICGYTYDDGFSIACDDCSRWCHAACFDIVEGGVPEEWRCWVCVPRPVDCEKAAKLQRERLRVVGEKREIEKRGRKGSPGHEKKHRRASAAAIEGSGPKRKRRLSVVHHNEDEHVDIDEPWTHSYVHIMQDIIPNQDTRVKLRRQAHHWRGISALTPPSPYDSVTPVRLSPQEQSSQAFVKPLSSSSTSHPALSLFTNPDVRPPTYAVHTTAPVLSERLIAPYTSSITPSSFYLSDPLNGYAHLGMPKPFVHLVGPPLDLALDSRIAGNSSRFVRNGCRPNAVLRPVLCQPFTEENDNNYPDSSYQPISFGVFALRDLKANEEVVLGWEWDDGNAVHSLPALIETPMAFGHTFNHHDRPSEIKHLRDQMSNMLHVLSSTFTTCACGARAKDCALTQMAAFVDGHFPVPSSSKPVDLGPLVGRKRGFKTREKVPYSGGLGGVEMCSEDELPSSSIPPSLPDFALSPKSPSPRKGKGKARAKGKSKGGIEEDDSDESGRERSSVVYPPTRELDQSVHQPINPKTSMPQENPPDTHDLRPPDPPGEGRENETEMDVDVEMEGEEIENKMPPKLRKRWIHRDSDTWKDYNARSPSSPNGNVMSFDGVNGKRNGLGIRMEKEGNYHSPEENAPSDMPPPPMPASKDPTTISSVEFMKSRRSISPQDHIVANSPSASFAKLSLLSPIIPGSVNGSTSLISPTQDMQPMRRTFANSYFSEHAREFSESVHINSVITPSVSLAPNTQHQEGQKPPTEETQDSQPTSNGMDIDRGHVPIQSPDATSDVMQIDVTDSSSVEEVKSSQPTPPSPANEPTAYSTPLAYTSSHTAMSPTSPQSPYSMGTSSSASTLLTSPPSPHTSPTPVPRISISEMPSPGGHSEILHPASPEQKLQTLSPAVSPQSYTSAVSPAAEESDQSQREPSPPPPPKVKMSLKDFALRKKRQREEELKTIHASPMGSDSVSLSEGEPDAIHGKQEVLTDDVVLSRFKEQKNGLKPFPTEDTRSDPITPIPPLRIPKETPQETFGSNPERNGVLLDPHDLAERAKALLHGLSNRSTEISMMTLPVSVNLTTPKTLEAKIEKIEQTVPRLSSLPPNNTSSATNGETDTVLMPRKSQYNELPPVSINNHHPVHGQSREDGEILDSSPEFAEKTSKDLRATFVPRSRSPPTQPRSFQSSTSNPNSRPPLTPLRSPVSTPQMLTQPQTQPQAQTQTQAQAAHSNPPNPRPLPSAPRALRVGSVYGQLQQPAYAPPPPPRSYSGGQYIPRGPSADRDRQDWDRGDRWQYRSRSRGGHSAGR